MDADEEGDQFSSSHSSQASIDSLVHTTQHNIILNSSSSSPLFSSIESIPTCIILFTTLLFPFFSGNHPVLTTCIYVLWTTTIIGNPKPIITTTTTTAPKRVFVLFWRQAHVIRKPPIANKLCQQCFVKKVINIICTPNWNCIQEEEEEDEEAATIFQQISLCLIFLFFILFLMQDPQKKKNLRCHKNDKRRVSV